MKGGEKSSQTAEKKRKINLQPRENEKEGVRLLRLITKKKEGKFEDWGKK